MNKLLEYGRKALFYIRVLSGHEERRIRTMRILMENRIKQAEERKAAIRRIPEQAILQEVRHMVEQMHNLNKQLTETEAAIDEYFKPLDHKVQSLMKVQLEGEEKSMKQMMRAMQEQALRDQAESLQNPRVHNVDSSSINQESEPTAKQEANSR